MATRGRFDELVAELPDHDWENARLGIRLAGAWLERAATSGVIPDALDALGSSPALLAKCEHLRGLNKLVLHDDRTTGVRLRLDVFGAAYEDLPHNHRWSYASRIVRGGYDQFVHGTICAESTPADLRTMAPVFATHFGPGATHFLHHSVVHSLSVLPYTISLVLRGPAVRSHALWSDRSSGEVWLHQGGDSDARKQTMVPEVVATLGRELRGLAVWSAKCGEP